MVLETQPTYPLWLFIRKNLGFYSAKKQNKTPKGNKWPESHVNTSGEAVMGGRDPLSKNSEI